MFIFYYFYQKQKSLAGDSNLLQVLVHTIILVIFKHFRVSKYIPQLPTNTIYKISKNVCTLYSLLLNIFFKYVCIVYLFFLLLKTLKETVTFHLKLL